MAVVKSAMELAQLDGTFEPSQVRGKMSFPTWTGICDECTKPIKLDQPFWFWIMSYSFVYMHIDCFVGWVDKLTVEAGAAIERGEIE